MFSTDDRAMMMGRNTDGLLNVELQYDLRAVGWKEIKCRWFCLGQGEGILEGGGRGKGRLGYRMVNAFVITR